MSVCLSIDCIVFYCIVLYWDVMNGRLWGGMLIRVPQAAPGGRISFVCLFVGGSYSCDGDGDGNGAVSDIFLWRWSGEEVVGGLKSKSGLGLGDCWLCRG